MLPPAPNESKRCPKIIAIADRCECANEAGNWNTEPAKFCQIEHAEPKQAAHDESKQSAANKTNPELQPVSWWIWHPKRRIWMGRGIDH